MIEQVEAEEKEETKKAPILEHDEDALTERIVSKLAEKLSQKMTGKDEEDEEAVEEFIERPKSDCDNSLYKSNY